MIIFDMTTTAINNYMDYKKAKSENTGARKISSGRKIFLNGRGHDHFDHCLPSLQF